MPEYIFQENAHGAYPVVTIHCNGMRFGAPLNDNAWEEDFYRYHDVFHLGLYALHGYSAVTAHLTGEAANKLFMEREEYLSAITFNEAKRQEFFQNAKPSAWLYHCWQDFAEGTPLTQTSREDWESNLKTIYGVFNLLVENRGGIVEAEPENKIFRYRNLKPD